MVESIRHKSTPPHKAKLLFCCFDKGNLVILFNGFQKKSQKTPKKEIELALKLKEDYFNAKKKM